MRHCRNRSRLFNPQILTLMCVIERSETRSESIRATCGLTHCVAVQQEEAVRVPSVLHRQVKRMGSVQVCLFLQCGGKHKDVIQNFHLIYTAELHIQSSHNPEQKSREEEYSPDWIFIYRWTCPLMLLVTTFVLKVKCLLLFTWKFIFVSVAKMLELVGYFLILTEETDETERKRRKYKSVRHFSTTDSSHGFVDTQQSYTTDIPEPRSGREILICTQIKAQWVG